MEMQLQISARGFELESGTEGLIRRYAERLDRFYGRITAVRVMVEVPQRRMGEPILYNVRFDVMVPGGEVVVTRQRQMEVHTAIQRSYEAVRRRLQDYARRQRGKVKGQARARA